MPARPSARAISDLWLFVLLFCLSLAVYWPALEGTPLWDDSAHLTTPELQSFDGLRRIWTDRPATQQYYPLLHSAFWLEHRLWGDSVSGYHLVNVLLHALSACLVVLIVRALRLPGAPLAGFLFALHPVSVEAVAWISEQKSTLSAVFYLASALVYLRFDQERRKRLYVYALALFIFALLSKTVTATLPAALWIVLWWRKGRLEWKCDVLPLLPWIVIGASAGLFTAWVERTDIGARGSAFNLSLIDRGLVAGRALWFYLGKLVWPVNLAFIYPRWEIHARAPWQYLFPIGAFVVFIAFALLAFRGIRAPLAALLYFSVTLFPVLGFLNVYPFIYSFVADHFQYLARLGVLVPVAASLTAFTGRMQGIRAMIAPVTLCLVLAILSWRQSAMYRDPETLYRATIALNPSCWMAHNNLGNLLAPQPGRSQEAIREYEAAVQWKPDYAEAHYNLANLLIQQDPQSAITHYRAAIRLDPDFAQAHANLATALAPGPGRLPEAIAEYKAAIRLVPGLAVTHFDLANAMSQSSDLLPQAIAEYRKAIELNPDFLEAHYNLALALTKAPGNSTEAIEHLEAALRLRPDLTEARQLIERLRSAKH